jgi:hypothetical protein
VSNHGIYLLYEGIEGNVIADGYKHHVQIDLLGFGDAKKVYNWVDQKTRITIEYPW